MVRRTRAGLVVALVVALQVFVVGGFTASVAGFDPPTQPPTNDPNPDPDSGTPAYGTV